MTPADYKAIREGLMDALGSHTSRRSISVTEGEREFWSEQVSKLYDAINAIEKYKPESEE